MQITMVLFYSKLMKELENLHIPLGLLINEVSGQANVHVLYSVMCLVC